MNSYASSQRADHSAAARAQRAEFRTFAAASDDKLILLRVVFKFLTTCFTLDFQEHVFI